MTSNEAAERLREYRRPNGDVVLVRPMPGAGGEEALVPAWAEAAIKAAERRATVERIREAALEKRKRWGAEGLPASLAAILDEERDR